MSENPPDAEPPRQADAGVGGSLRFLAGKTALLAPRSATGVEYVISANQREYAYISLGPEITLEAHEGTWEVVQTGRRGWNLAATTKGGAPAAWFQRSLVAQGGKLLLPDGTERRLRRRVIKRACWVLACDEGWLARFAVQAGKQPWEVTADLALSESASRHDKFPVVLLLSCVTVVLSRATETQNAGLPADTAPVGGL